MDAYQKVKDKLDELDWIWTPTCLHDWAGRFLYWRSRKSPDQIHVFDQQKKSNTICAIMDDQNSGYDDFKDQVGATDSHVHLNR